MEEFDWRDMLNNRRNNKENTVSCDQRDDVQAWSQIHSQPNSQSAKLSLQGVAGANGNRHQSCWKVHSNHWSYNVWWSEYLKTWL